MVADLLAAVISPEQLIVCICDIHTNHTDPVSIRPTDITADQNVTIFVTNIV